MDKIYFNFVKSRFFDNAFKMNYSYMTNLKDFDSQRIEWNSNLSILNPELDKYVLQILEQFAQLPHQGSKSWIERWYDLTIYLYGYTFITLKTNSL